MAPTISDAEVYDVKLGEEDIKAVQRLYGLKTKQSPARPRPRIPLTTPRPSAATTLSTSYLRRTFVPSLTADSIAQVFFCE